MALYKLVGRADRDGACGKPFEVIVESNDSNFEAFSSKKEAAIKAIHPDWKAIIVNSWTKLK